MQAYNEQNVRTPKHLFGINTIHLFPGELTAFELWEVWGTPTQRLRRIISNYKVVLQKILIRQFD